MFRPLFSQNYGPAECTKTPERASHLQIINVPTPRTSPTPANWTREGVGTPKSVLFGGILGHNAVWPNATLKFKALRLAENLRCGQSQCSNLRSTKWAPASAPSTHQVRTEGLQTFEQKFELSYSSNPFASLLIMSIVDGRSTRIF